MSAKVKIGAWELYVANSRGGNPMAYVDGPKWSDSGMLGHDGIMRWDFPERIPASVKTRAYRMVVKEREARGLKKIPD
jgi:hypothetical protein